MIVTASVIVLISSFFVGQGECDPSRVTIPELGTIQGGANWTFPLFTPTRREFYFFAGIPYASPESYTGPNRFKPSKVWEGALESDPEKDFQATDFSIACPQSGVSFADDEESGSEWEHRDKLNNGKIDFLSTMVIKQTEECLVMNINAPEKLPGKLFPVILFIHGGSFDSSSAGQYQAHRFLTKDVIFITINYRLGLLGSLNLGIDDAPGNAALYDIITALKWIKTHIEHFGGDKDQVTVTGHSAGAVLATHLLTSDLAFDGGEPLLHGIIGLSGSSLSRTMAISIDPVSQHLRVSEMAGCYDSTANNNAPNFNEIRECMANRTVDVLVEALNELTISEVKQGRFGLEAKLPSLQAQTLSIPKIIVEDPYIVLKEKRQKLDIPVMMGTTRHDGSYLVDSELELFWRPNDLVHDPVYLRNELIPNLVESLNLDDPSGEMIHSLQKIYMGDGFHLDDFESKVPGLIDIYSVLAFKAGAYELVELNAKKDPHSYYFSFDHYGLCSAGGSLAVPGGVGHLNTLFYLFPTTCPLLLPTDLSVSQRFIDYWVKFATYGNPNGDSRKTVAAPYNPLNHAYLKIGMSDTTGYYCRDAWIGNSFELMKDVNATTNSPPSTGDTSATSRSTSEHGSSAQTSKPSTDTTEGSGNNSNVLIPDICMIIFTLSHILMSSFLNERP